MQAPSDPELMEALNSLSETEPIETLRVALDQMRHFLWFYLQIIGTESEMGEKLRQTLRQKPSDDGTNAHEISVFEKIRYAADAAMVRYLTEGKARKPN